MKSTTGPRTQTLSHDTVHHTFASLTFSDQLYMGNNMNAHTSVAIVPANLAQLADLGESDACDIAEAAMPDLVIGDLAPDDEAWIRQHTITCNYCANVLEGLEQVCSTLDTCNEALAIKVSLSESPTPASCLGLSEARYGFMETPVGDVLVAASPNGILEVSYVGEDGTYDTLREIEQRGFLVYEQQDSVQPAVEQLQEYFAHRRTTFSLPLDLTGVSDFTRGVLDAANTIPFGKVRTYGDVARAIGKPRASRAVGNALGRNPIPVIIPCHRVILASGAMGWYTGGPEIKRALLNIEGISWMHTAQQSFDL
jgi:methylated-DNA-[protein]-cysteine S-methyltransferase